MSRKLGWKAFLRTVRNEDGPVGDLAQDWLADATAPRVECKMDMLDHLDARRACSDAITTSHEAWRRYLTWRYARTWKDQ